MRLELVMKSIVPVVMAGVLGIYDLIIVVVISTRINPKAKSYCLFDGYAHLSFGLTYGLASLSTGMAIGIVGDVGVSLFSHIHKVTHLSNSKIEEELKVKMPSLDKKYAMELGEVGHELLLYSKLSSSHVEIPQKRVIGTFQERADLWNELKSRGMLKVGKRKKVQFLRNDETKKLLKKQEDDVAVIHTNGIAVHIHKVTHLSNSKIEKELKAKMPSLDKKYAMEPEEVGHEGGAGMSLRVKGYSSGVRGRKFNS
ncbi:hypothetical protein Patl1_35142 [Pistacia atlantica]|uniref:Uncharacterized protein n=1 Tax=Pistacia atlantica TaxID=434234 RepID=A0ACC0ZSS0_9ROSI|nr:hypothetical protein Patl1_35142 [Pistacia atlantica]